MLIYKCSKCHWIGDNPDVYTDTEYCPRCRTTESLHIVHQKEAEFDGLYPEGVAKLTGTI